MDVAEYARYDGVGLAQLVKRRELTKRGLAALFLAAVEKVNPKINSVIETYGGRVATLDDSSVSDGPFVGVPFLLKDIGAAEKGQRQEVGSRLLKGYVVENDAFLTARFREAGLSVLGRSTTPEFALSITTESVLMGVTRNPWNLAMLAGGSSGGAAASVAAGILPVAHGSDGAGSIRIPASACGLVGLKPSRGRVTQGPDSSEGLAGMSQEFVVTRTVRDTAVMLDAVSQPAPGDPFIIVQPERPYSQEVNVAPRKLRVAWTAQSWQPGTEVHPEVVRCVEQVADTCHEMGHQLVEISPVFDYEEYLRALCILWEFGFDVSLNTLAAKMGRKINEETLEPVTLSYYREAQRVSAANVIAADDVLNKVRRTLGRFFQEYDVLMTPTLAQPPEPHEKYATTRTDLDFVGFMRLCDETCMYCPLFNVTGQPAITVPLGQSKSGLPLGVQFAARFGDEATLIRMASTFEQVMPWHDRVPPIHVSN